ncbi:MAG: glycosyl hydrolase [Sphingomonas sp. 28-66-16]|nr:MAG: glycosyl hydrolase [Sphingomonas sp. 28-66-16]
MRRWTRRLGAIGGLGVVIGLAAIVTWSFAISWQPARRDYPFQGIAVGAAEAPIEWAVVRGGGADFAYLTATIGAEQRDPTFERSWSDVYAAGLRRGAVHVYSLCRLAADQANNFNTTVPRADDALPAAVEIDFHPDCAARPEPGVVADELVRFLTMVEAHTGKPMLLKISKRFEARYHLSAAIPRPIWSEGNFFPPDYAARPWRMWQASDMRRIDGAPTAVRWNVVAQ